MAATDGFLEPTGTSMLFIGHVRHEAYVPVMYDREAMKNALSVVVEFAFR